MVQNAIYRLHLEAISRMRDRNDLSDFYRQNEIDGRVLGLKKETRNNLSFLAFSFLILILLNVPYSSDKTGTGY